MARDVHKQWDDEGNSDGESDECTYKYDQHRRLLPREIKFERERRWAVTAVAKCSIISAAMILFCVFMYIPVYYRANDQLPVPKVAVAGWSIHTNRDTKIYVQPDNVTSLHEPKDVCPRNIRKSKNSLFLLIVVCSSTSNFAERIAIRETWGNYKNYLHFSKIFKATREKYKDYNYTYDLYEEVNSKSVNLSINKVDRAKRHISGLNQLLPEIANALQSNLDSVKNESPVEKRFDDEDDKEQEMLPEFDMNMELNNQNDDLDMDYDYPSNIMKIPPNGYEDTSPDLRKILTILRKSNDLPKKKEEETNNTEVDFKLLFLLGLPSQDNDTEVQEKIDEEVEKYGDVIQEGFIDSYNNLTLKSIMMLKWVTNNCNDSVRYILKTDDDIYVNVPNLVQNLRNRSRVHDSTKGQELEYLLIGDLFCGARPVQDVGSKWYSPRYMYNARVYPHYLSGTGYALSAPTAAALYKAAITTKYFHLEDIYITGICAVHAKPRITPRDEPGFSYTAVGNNPCVAHAHLTAHRVEPEHMRHIATKLVDPEYVDMCERKRLTQVRKERLKSKRPNKKLAKLALT